MGDAEGLRATAKAAEAAGKMNVAMTSYFLLQDLDAVLKLLPQQASLIPALAKLAKFAGFANLTLVAKLLQIFGGLVLGCIKTKFCKKICV